MRIHIVRRIAKYYFLLLIVISFVACGSKDSHKRVVITGSSTVAPLMAELGKAYEKKHKDVRIDVQAGGSSRGVADTRQGVADIGMISRALKESENDLVGHAIANDAICIIAHASNPVNELTEQQIIDIYTGKIKKWSEAGGPDADVVVVNKAEGRSTLELFLKHFKLESGDVDAEIIIGDNEQGIKTIAGNPHAIGYVSVGTAEYDIGQGVKIKIIKSRDASGNETAINRVLNLVTKEEPKGVVKDVIDFAQSKDAHELIRKQYFDPIAR